MLTEAVEGDWFWLIGGGPMQVPALLKLVDLGYKIILTDLNSNCAGITFADYFSQTDIYDSSAHLRLLDQIPEEIVIRIKGVTCIATDCHHTVAALVAKLGLPGISVQLSKAIGEKQNLRKWLKQVGVGQPSSLYVTKKESLSNYLKEIDLISKFNRRLVIKPLGWSASKGIKILDDGSNIEQEITSSLDDSRNGEVILEELLESDGKFSSEASIETLVQHGKVYYLNMVDRIFNPDLNFLSDCRVPEYLNVGVEFGHINPTQRSPEEIAQIINQLQKFIDILEVNRIYCDETFILKADIFFSQHGPMILEATPRTSGGWDSSYSSPQREIQIQDLAIQISLGKEINGEEINRKYRPGYVAVVTNVTSDSKDCLGRTFFGGALSNSPSSAIISALDEKDKGNSL
jgi:biotin carboxylase